MRARYYNPDIKRFINQDIKIGDIGNSQSLNRYAYCEGNPVSLIDPFGLSPQGAQDQGEKSAIWWLHGLLDAAGIFVDGADVINAGLYALEGNWTEAALCAVAIIPVAGSFIKGGIKGLNSIRKAGKVANVVETVTDVCKTAKNAGNVAEALSDTMRSAAKWGDEPLKLMDGITADAASKGWKALENGGDFARESQKAAWEMKVAVGADGYRMTTKADEAASLLKKGAKGGSCSLGVDELVPRDSKFLRADGKIDWETWAPNNGRVPGSIQDNQILAKGTIIDRYGNKNGTYTSPVGVPYEQRALPYIENPNAYHQYEVLKPINNVTISKIAEAFEQPGGGMQYELPFSVKQLIKDGFLKELK